MADDRQKRLRIPGVEDTERGLGAPRLIRPQVITIKESRAFQINASRAGSPDSPELETRPDDVVEMELEGGIRIWTSRLRLEELLRPAGKRDGGAAVELPASLTLIGPSRGPVGTVLIKALRFFGIDVPELAAGKIATLWETKTLGSEDGRGPGLYRCSPSAKFELTPWDGAPAGTGLDRPILLFLHGTFSSTQGSFGELWAPERRDIREQLFAAYRDHILAFEHKTLTESPILNAIELARKLPKEARLHLISHSRGGLVGEFLCRARMEGMREPFTADELELLREREREDDRQALSELNELLKEKRFRIERFVRVACPARGTTLASERFDLYLSCIFNLIERIPLFQTGPLQPVLDVFTELIMAVAKERFDPHVLPGIEPMVPSSPLVALLNRQGTKVEGELRVIAGDIEGGTLASLFKTLLTDPLYQDDHDLVVNTAAMFGGAERTGGAAFSFHQGPNVSHFRYFQNEESTRRLVAALTRKEGQADGFEPFPGPEAKPTILPARGEDRRPRPVVFILPGIMGSHLAVGGDRVWLDPADLAFGGFDRLAIDAQGVQPEAPVGMAYGDLMKYLSGTHEVVPFPYDWRRSLEEEGKRLGKAIERKLDEAERYDQPVRILAHSMGGLLARVMIALCDTTWQRLCKHPSARLVMLGTPNGGSYVIPQVLTGRDSLIKKLALLDVKHSLWDLLRIVSEYPGLLELLPSQGTFDLFTPEAWIRIQQASSKTDKWTTPSDARLLEARRVRTTLIEKSPVDPERMLYVAGWAPATPVDLEIGDSAGDGDRLVFHATPHGDGRVPWETGRLEGVRTWYMHASHGDLADQEESFPAILDLLQKGTTTRLPTAAPEARGVPERFVMPVEKEALYPDAAELTAAALGSRRKPRKEKVERRARVTVLHGNLNYASHPVMVGHYQGDAIVHAEAHLDRVLDGRLRARHRLGLYPGAEGTVEVFLDPGKRPGGGIVVGLGQVGSLSPGGLSRAVSRGVRSYALALCECEAHKGAPAGGTLAAGISTLLVGTNEGGISVEDGATAILRGVAHANQSLAQTEYGERVRIDEVEFVELYEDRAIQTARGLARVRQDVQLARGFDIDEIPQVRGQRGGRRRASLAEGAPWWQRLQIEDDGADGLAFNLLTDRARAEVYLERTQRVLVDRFIQEAVETAATSEETAVTLYEMLVPNEIKEYAPEQRDLVLVVDEDAARYPWELMQERSTREEEGPSSGRKPLAIQAGMVRQLETLELRGHVVTAVGRAALVVGDPPSSFAPLPAAQAEAGEVKTLLENWGYDVPDLIRQGAKDILKALYTRDYRIVHLAGHGVYNVKTGKKRRCDHCGVESEEPGVTGMVIGDDQFLTPAEINQMRAVPELVFINCCYLGKIEGAAERPPNDPPKLAANVATELIRMGVHAVVAAGWAVNDEAARTFAGTFYREMLNGVSFGKAVQRARKDVFDTYPGINTWGAYQCYGDPAFALSPTSAGGASTAGETRFTAPSEAIVELGNIAEDATTASETEIADLKTRLKEIADHMPAEWLANGELRAALGRAFGELDLFKKAVTHYKAALRAEKSSCSLRTAEQLYNFETRWAVELVAKNPDKAKKLMAKAKERLGYLMQASGATGERLSLMGSIAKREAMIAPTPEGRRQALQEMATSYRKAYEVHLETTGEIDPFPMVNWLTAQVLLALTGAKARKPAKLAERLQRASGAAAEQDRRDPNFWDAVAPVECELLAHLAARDLGEHVAAIVSGYLQAKKRDASPREFRSVLEHLDFLVQVVGDAADAKLRTELGAALSEIRRGVAV